MQTNQSNNMLLVVGLKTCSTVKKTINWLENNEVEFTFQDLKKKPLNRDELLDLVHKLSLETVLNKRGTTWKKLAVNSEELSTKQMFDLLLENQSMIKRPVLVLGEAVMVGFEPEALEAFVESGS
jgi:arsenate reductase (glutaredoxin)